LAGFRRHLSRGAWLFPSSCCCFPFGCDSIRRRQFQLRLFGSAMVAMVQRLDARSLCFCSQLIVSTFLALVLKVFRNRLSRHGRSVAELSPSKLSNFGHLVTNGCPRAPNGTFHLFPARRHPQFWVSTFWARIPGRPGTRGHPDGEGASRGRSTAYRWLEVLSLATEKPAVRGNSLPWPPYFQHLQLVAGQSVRSTNHHSSPRSREALQSIVWVRTARCG
jgi:hypothetical protein